MSSLFIFVAGTLFLLMCDLFPIVGKSVWNPWGENTFSEDIKKINDKIDDLKQCVADYSTQFNYWRPMWLAYSNGTLSDKIAELRYGLTKPLYKLEHAIRQEEFGNRTVEWLHATKEAIKQAETDFLSLWKEVESKLQKKSHSTSTSVEAFSPHTSLHYAQMAMPPLLDYDATIGFPLDADETEHEYLINADLPGVYEEDIEVDLLPDHYLQIRAKRDRLLKEVLGNVSFSEVVMIHRERLTGIMSRTIRLPWDADEEKVAYVFTFGVLTVRIPKNKEVVYSEPHEPPIVHIRVTH